ncbi:MAG: helix-turn-helix domain-containing protein [Streptococcus salivarius]|jgi:transcriptional regulator with XRE-family HTH domain
MEKQENRLRILRKEKGLTQTKLANEIGVSKRTIIAWENDERQIKPEKAQLLAKHFGVSVGYLLGYDNSPSKIFLKELEEQADHYLTDEEKEELKARPEAKNYYLDLVSWRMRDEQLAQLQQQDKEFDKDFIKFIEKYSIYLSDNQINQIKDLMKSMSSINTKYLNVITAGRYFGQMKDEKETEFKELFKYSKTWQEEYSTMEYNEKNNIK